MGNFRTLLLTFLLSTILAIGNCQVEKALKTLDNARKLSGQTAFSTTERIKDIIKESDIARYDMSDDVLIMMEELTIGLMEFDVNDTMEVLANQIVDIDTISTQFHKFIDSTDNFTDFKVLDEYFEGLWNEMETITDSLEYINFLTTRKKISGLDLFSLSGQRIQQESKGGVCDGKKLTLGHLWNFYNLIFDMELKGSFLLLITYRYLTMRDIEYHEHSILRAKQNAETRFHEYSKKAHQAMESAPREISTCDDGNYIKGQTYIELTGFSQGFLINPVFIEGADNCHVNTPRDDYCIKNPQLCLHEKCSELGGKVNKCKDLTEGRPELQMLSMCPAEDEGKRYSWVELDGKFFGNHLAKKPCSKPLIKYKMFETQPSSFLFFHWSKTVQKRMCFCHCERTKWRPGDVRAISFSWTEADYGNNKVITDVKFEEKNGIIQLSVQQGRLLSGGRIDQSSLSWMETPNAVPIKNSEKDAPDYFLQDEESSTEWLPDYDFEYISNASAMILSNIAAPKNHVVVGVTFQKIVKGDLHGIELLVASMNFNFTTGRLEHDKVHYSSVNPILGHYEDFGIIHNPIQFGKFDITLDMDTIVQFQQSDWKKDLGQSIVPFFDIRPVEPKIAFPLSGVGLYHRKSKDSGGFFALNLITYDVSENLEDD